MAKVKEVFGVTDQGEVIKGLQHSYKYKNIPTEQFIIVYLKDIVELMNLLQLSEVKLLSCLWTDSIYSTDKGEGNIVYSNAFNKNKWFKETGIKVSTINTILCKLEKKNFIKRLGTSMYVLNPEYFYKGDRNSRFLVKEQLKPLFDTNDSKIL